MRSAGLRERDGERDAGPGGPYAIPVGHVTPVPPRPQMGSAGLRERDGERAAGSGGCYAIPVGQVTPVPPSPQ